MQKPDVELQAGGVPQLVGLLSAGLDSEITEYAAAALGNLAAGGHALKDAMREVSLAAIALFPNGRIHQPSTGKTASLVVVQEVSHLKQDPSLVATSM